MTKYDAFAQLRIFLQIKHQTTGFFGINLLDPLGESVDCGFHFAGAGEAELFYRGFVEIFGKFWFREEENGVEFLANVEAEGGEALPFRFGVGVRGSRAGESIELCVGFGCRFAISTGRAGGAAAAGSSSGFRLSAGFFGHAFPFFHQGFCRVRNFFVVVTLELRYGRADESFGEDSKVDGSVIEALENVEDFFVAAFARWTGLFFVKVFL